jgi:GGDEF domain-containing protein
MLHVSCSAGASFYPNEDALPELLMRHADLALYQAKAAGRNCLRIFGDVSGSINTHEKGR